jgi:hypothetical protein
MRLEDAIDPEAVSLLLVCVEKASSLGICERLDPVASRCPKIVVGGSRSQGVTHVEAVDSQLIPAVNSGLATVNTEYVAVLDGRMTFIEPGWLGHGVAFLEHRPDAGLVSLGGWHSVGADGECGHPTDEVDLRGWKADKPVWRFTEVAAARGAGVVMRSADGLRLDESMPSLAAAFVDLSLGCIYSGTRVYSENAEHQFPAGRDEDLRPGLLASRWAGILPVERWYADEESGAGEIDSLNREIEERLELNAALEARCRNSAEEWSSMALRLEDLGNEARALEAEHAANAEEISRLTRLVEEAGASPPVSQEAASGKQRQGSRLMRKMGRGRTGQDGGS